MTTIRAKFQKEDELKYISHLDLMRLFQRAFRRADIPISYTQGYTPHPKFSLATALSLGITSDGEYMDVELDERMDVEKFIKQMNGVLPSGVKIIKAAYVNENKSLMSIISWSTYVIQFSLQDVITREKLVEIINNFLSKEQINIVKEKKKKGKLVKKEVNVRGYIKKIIPLIIEDERVVIRVTLKTGSKGNLKPEALVNLLDRDTSLKVENDTVKIHRMDLYSENNGELNTPL